MHKEESGEARDRGDGQVKVDLGGSRWGFSRWETGHDYAVISYRYLVTYGEDTVVGRSGL